MDIKSAVIKKLATYPMIYTQTDQSISRAVVTKIFQIFYEAGRVENRPKVVRPKTVTGLDNQQLLIERTVEEPRISTNNLSMDYGQIIVGRILKSHKANSNKAKLVQE